MPILQLRNWGPTKLRNILPLKFGKGQFQDMKLAIKNEDSAVHSHLSSNTRLASEG